jgi:hypothetical protein
LSRLVRSGTTHIADPSAARVETPLEDEDDDEDEYERPKESLFL